MILTCKAYEKITTNYSLENYMNSFVRNWHNKNVLRNIKCCIHNFIKICTYDVESEYDYIVMGRQDKQIYKIKSWINKAII